MNDEVADPNENVVSIGWNGPVEGFPTTSVVIDADGNTCLSRGRTANDGDALILSEATVWTETAPAQRAIVLIVGPAARMVEARINQEMLPIRATAVWDGVCWNVSSLHLLSKDA